MTARCITPLAAPPHSRSGLRRVHLARDLPAIADLIEIAYQDELALMGSNLVERLRQLAAMAPLMGLVDRFTDILDGYVWTEDGELVGNLTLGGGRTTRGIPIRGGWTISNVAVLPAYRGRGIAGKLVDAALLHMRTIGARCVLLQVRSDNAPALALYRHRGFAVYDTITELRLQRRCLRPAVLKPDPRIEPVRPRDVKSLVQLARQNQPSLLRSLGRIRRSDLGLALWQQLARRAAAWLGLPAPSILVAHANGQIAAYARLASMGSRMLHLELGLAPGQDQELIRSLVATILASTGITRWSQVLVKVPAKEAAARAALKALGFEPLRTLHGMIWEPKTAMRGMGRLNAEEG